MLISKKCKSRYPKRALLIFGIHARCNLLLKLSLRSIPTTGYGREINFISNFVCNWWRSILDGKNHNKKVIILRQKFSNRKLQITNYSVTSLNEKKEQRRQSYHSILIHSVDIWQSYHSILIYSVDIWQSYHSILIHSVDIWN